MADQFISREEALAQGLKRYFDGLPCIHGHVAAKLMRKDRTSGACAECRRLASLRWKDEHADHCREYARRWGRENREAKLEWHRRNRESQHAANRRYYAKNREAMVERGKASGHRRRARKHECGGSHTAADLRAILKAQNHRCAYCRADLRKVQRHLDHIMPLARGGSNGPENLQYLCEPCNRSKGAKHPTEFARERGLLL
jgi:5-methylcytosine-specific restriction endonuclease McrA